MAVADNPTEHSFDRFGKVKRYSMDLSLAHREWGLRFAEQCGRREHLNDDHHVVTLSNELLAAPPIELWQTLCGASWFRPISKQSC